MAQPMESQVGQFKFLDQKREILSEMENAFDVLFSHRDRADSQVGRTY